MKPNNSKLMKIGQIAWIMFMFFYIYKSGDKFIFSLALIALSIVFITKFLYWLFRYREDTDIINKLSKEERKEYEAISAIYAQQKVRRIFLSIPLLIITLILHSIIKNPDTLIPQLVLTAGILIICLLNHPIILKEKEAKHDFLNTTEYAKNSQYTCTQKLI